MIKAYMKKTLMSAVAITAVLGAATTASAEDIREAMAAAYESNPQLGAQRAAQRAIDEGVYRAKSGFMPFINGSYVHEDSYRDNINDPTEFLNENITQSTSLTAQQSLFRGFQDRYAMIIAKSQVQAGRAQLLDVEQNILLGAITAYMNVVRDEAIYGLNVNQVQVLKRELQAANDRFRVGEITRTDVAQSEARLENAKSRELSAEAALAASRALYLRMIGKNPGTLKKPTSRPQLPGSLELALEAAVANAPSVIAAEYNEKAARFAVHQRKGGLLPSIDASLSYQKVDTNTFSGVVFPETSFVTKSAAVQITVPLYQGGAEYSDIRRAKQQRSQALMNIRQAERLAQEATLVAWNNHRAAEGQIISSKASVRANEIALDGVRQEAAVGSRTTLEVLNAEQELLNSRSNLVSSERNELVAAYNLLSTMGKLTAAELNLDVTAYDPKTYYNRVKNKVFGW